MFVIGEIQSKVSMSKLGLPKEYHLRKKKIFAVWKGEKVLFLSDEERVLKPETAGGGIFIPHIDANNRLEVPSGLNNHSAKIEGCIWKIKIEFE